MGIFYSSIILIGLVLTGCNSTQPKPKHSKFERPNWLNNTLGGAVGSCGSHMKGKAAQEELALDRALTELAKQKKAIVSSKSYSTQKESGISYTSTNINNTQVSADALVSSEIKAKWRDPRTNIFYIWVVAK
ncbi:MAG: hypothetical protein U9P72_08020 [Campylobacterota bacterium]|nr:hypothetical protein [Campylobacterota bacterium]